MASKASASDPRRPEAIVPWVPLKPHPNDVPFDYWSLLGMGFGVAALVLRVRECAVGSTPCLRLNRFGPRRRVGRRGRARALHR